MCVFSSNCQRITEWNGGDLRKMLENTSESKALLSAKSLLMFYLTKFFVVLPMDFGWDSHNSDPFYQNARDFPLNIRNPLHHIKNSRIRFVLKSFYSELNARYQFITTHAKWIKQEVLFLSISAMYSRFVTSSFHGTFTQITISSFEQYYYFIRTMTCNVCLYDWNVYNSSNSLTTSELHVHCWCGVQLSPPHFLLLE